MADITRSSGILMPIFSLPSPCGIGTLGKAAYDFIDFLSEAGQSWWQILPVGPTGYGDSPYQSFSAFAGNPYFIDFWKLMERGLLKREEFEGYFWGSDPERVDYGVIYENRMNVLKIAAKRGIPQDREAFNRFVQNNSDWLPDYALYMAVKTHFGSIAWTQWPDRHIRLHEEEACRQYSQKLADSVELFEYIQFLFYRQWSELKAYAGEKGIRIIGDLPIYVAMDSADVWSAPYYFQLDEENRPTAISGCPPDAFTEEGQLWGNPLYDWERMKEDGYSWWIRRIKGATEIYDVLRIDHFRGFESYWKVPADAENAINGQWVKGPGMDVLNVLKEAFPEVAFIAEDLGFLTEEVFKLVADSGFPGMKVLQFGFDPREPGNYLPHTYPENSVCYTGTHDNSPIMLWKDEAGEAVVESAEQYLGIGEQESLAQGMIRGAMSSASKLCVAQLQDYLELGAGSRINIPGSTTGNWQWRLLPGAIPTELASEIREITKCYGRSKD